MAWLYGIQSGLFVKIGVAGNIPVRLKTMNLYNPHPCKVVIRRQLFDDAYHVEKRMHETLQPYAIGREWFAVDVALIKAALTIIIKQVRDEDTAWRIECARRATEKEQKQATRGLGVDLEARKIRKFKRDNKNKMLERLSEQ